jgi:trehalose synthase
LNGKEYSGRQLRQRTLEEMRTQAAGPAAPYNHLYRPQRDGVATTFAGFIAASLKIADPYHATPAQIDQIRRAQLLLAWANAMQPGVFSLSSWDLVGALPLPAEAVAERLEDQDYRWINRGAVDLLGTNPHARRSAYGVPRAQALYGSLPEQLRDPGSFASRLKEMLEARRRLRIPLATLVAVPEVEHPAVCVLLLKLPGDDAYAITALNFGREAVQESLDLAPFSECGARPLAGRRLLDAITGAVEGTVGADNRVELNLERLAGTTLILTRD